MRVNARAVAIPEKDVLRACLDYLNLQRGGKFWRRNVGVHASTYKGKRSFVRFGISGQCDIAGCYKGRHVEIEVKAKGKKPSPEQVLWMAAMVNAGAIVFWCDSVESCIRQWECQL